MPTNARTRARQRRVSDAYGTGNVNDARVALARGLLLSALRDNDNGLHWLLSGDFMIGVWCNLADVELDTILDLAREQVTVLEDR